MCQKSFLLLLLLLPLTPLCVRARAEPEPCGGADWILGSCAEGLVCASAAGPVLAPETGVCLAASSVRVGVEPERCPLVSGCERVDGECVCESRRSCRRKFTFLSKDACEHAGKSGSRRHQRLTRDRFVGPLNPSCMFSGCNVTSAGCVCSSHSCLEHFTYTNRTHCQRALEELNCAGVSCPTVPVPDCPSDSVAVHSHAPLSGCCPTPPAHCTCAPCPPPPDCSAGQRVVRVREGTTEPGHCCHTYTCQRVPLRCVHEEREFSEGELYQIHPCWQCQCRAGVSFCSKVECAEPDCHNFYVPEGECCPVCLDVELLSAEGGRASCWASERLRAHQEQWQEDDCTFCQCEDGETLCTAMSCALSCPQPLKIPGECCPYCPEESYESLSPLLCVPLVNCSLSQQHCPLGFQQDPSGCLLCQCVSNETCVSVSSSCALECPLGYRRDHTGCEVCECNSPSCRPVSCNKTCQYGYMRNKLGCEVCRCVRCPPFSCEKTCGTGGYKKSRRGCSLCQCSDSADGHVTSTAPTVSPGHCVTAGGRRHLEGEEWHDGCRDCFCSDGREMCVLISCPVPACAHPVLRPDQCCPACEDEWGSGQPEGTAEAAVCRAVGGTMYVEGERWSLSGCSRCTCRRGRILCEADACPPLACATPIQRAGDCCPACAEEERGGGAGGVCRSAEGVVRRGGASWRPDPCTSCSCSNGSVECFSERCPSAPCRVPLLRKGQCCPRCLELTTSSGTMAPPELESRVTLAPPLSPVAAGGVEVSLLYQSAGWILAAVLLVLTSVVLLNRRRIWPQMSCHGAPGKTVVLKKHVNKNSLVYTESEQITIPRAKLASGH